MIISIIAAMAENRVIGIGNKMPWNLPADRARFHAVTAGHAVILGRKTYESIGHPLSGRTNIVVTRRPDYAAPGCIVVHSLSSAFDACTGEAEVFVCGGEDIFRQTMGIADRIYLTIIHRNFEGDTFFPELPPGFTEASRIENGGPLPFTYRTYLRNGSSAAPGK